MPSIYTVRAVERAAQILMTFDSEHPERGVTEIARITKLQKATVHRILMTLQESGFVERSPDGERFRLGRKIIELGVGALGNMSLRQIAIPYMRQLVEQFRETCDLGVLDGHHVLFVEVIHSGRSLSIAAAVGRRLPLHSTAGGKAILAFQSPDFADRLLQGPLCSYTPNTITSPAALRAELERIRENGYAVDHEEMEVGIRAIAAPILTIDGYAEAAISIVGSAFRLTAEVIPQIAEGLKKVAQTISGRIVNGIAV